MKKIVAALLVAAIIVLIGGCEDSMIVKVAGDCADSNTKWGSTDLNISDWKGTEDGNARIEERIYPEGKPAFYIDPGLNGGAEFFSLIDYVESTNEFIYYYAGRAEGGTLDEQMRIKVYTQIIARYNPFTEKYTEIVNRDGTYIDNPPEFKFAIGSNKAYFFKLAGRVWHYQYAEDGGTLTEYETNVTEIQKNLEASYYQGQAVPGECTDIYALNSSKGFAYGVVLYGDSYSDYTIDDFLSGKDIITGDVYCAWRGDMGNKENNRCMFSLPNSLQLKACSFPDKEYFVVAASENNYIVIYNGNSWLDIGGDPKSDLDIGAITDGGRDYVAMYRTDSTPIYQLQTHTNGEGTTVMITTSYIGTIPAGVFSPVTKSQILMMGESNIFGASLYGIYNTKSRVRSGSYFALFKYSDDAIIAVGFEEPIKSKISIVDAEGNITKTETQNSATVWTDIANAHYYVYNIS